MNRISLAHYLSAAAKQLNPKAALELLEKQAAKLASEADSQDAVALLVMEAAHYKLVVGDVQGCKAAIKRCEKILEGIAAVAPSINATFYRVSADYYKITQSYPEYYHNALLFLSSVSLADLDKTVKQQRAHDLALSALLGADLYNFGELLTHPILQCLADTPYAWLRTLLLQYNSGDLEGFERLIKTADFMKQPLLVNSINFLRQKLCLMTLVEVVFRRSKAQRANINFLEISRETRVSLDEVEHIIMKALSLGLIKGNIDESTSTVCITWVQPRILGKEQISTIRSRIGEWSSKVDKRVKSLEDQEGFQTIFAQ